MDGGEGSATAVVRGLGRVGALAAVNAIGAVRDPRSGRWLAGASGPDGTVVPPVDGDSDRFPSTADRGTTLVVAVIELALDRRQLQRLAGQVHTALSRTLRPVHSSLDGDVAFVATTERRPAPRAERRPGATVDALGEAVASVTERAVIAAVSRRRVGPGR